MLFTAIIIRVSVALAYKIFCNLDYHCKFWESKRNPVCTRNVMLAQNMMDSHYLFSRLLRRFCSTVAPPVLTSTENVMHIRFASDDSVSTEGFSASYVALNASTSERLNQFMY